MERFTVKIDNEYIDVYAETFSEAFDKAMRVAASRGYTTVELPISKPSLPDSAKLSILRQLGIVAASLAVAAGASYALYKLMTILVGM